MPAKHDVLGIGNAIVDILAPVDEAFIGQHGLVKAKMTLLTGPEAELLYAAMPPAQEASGGSVANSVAAIASYGGNPAFIGEVADDQLGKIFKHDIAKAGVDFKLTAADATLGTARSFVLITPDAERTMATYLGACTQLNENDVDERLIKDSKIVFIEGYMWNDKTPGGQAAIMKAIELAKKYGRRIAFTLSDAKWVNANRVMFQKFAENHVDILIGNTSEFKELYETTNVDKALKEAVQQVELAVQTRGKDGAALATRRQMHLIPVEKLEGPVVDTTGAGDNFAGGVLFGYAHGYSLQDCGRLGTIAAAHVIQHIGARPTVALKTLLPRLKGEA